MLGHLFLAIGRFGRPRAVRPDNGGCFTSGVVTAVLGLAGIRHQRTEPGCPWMNGRIERFFGTLKAKLDTLVPADGARLYPGLPFIASGLGLGSVTPDGYDAVIESVVDHARRLQQQGAAAISLMGTSLSFYRGAAFNTALTEAMREATGLPCTTMSTAVLNGLRALGLRRVALATAYIDDVNERLAAFLGEADEIGRAHV